MIAIRNTILTYILKPAGLGVSRRGPHSETHFATPLHTASAVGAGQGPGLQRVQGSSPAETHSAHVQARVYKQKGFADISFLSCPVFAKPERPVWCRAFRGCPARGSRGSTHADCTPPSRQRQGSRGSTGRGAGASCRMRRPHRQSAMARTRIGAARRARAAALPCSSRDCRRPGACRTCATYQRLCHGHVNEGSTAYGSSRATLAALSRGWRSSAGAAAAAARAACERRILASPHPYRWPPRATGTWVAAERRARASGCGAVRPAHEPLSRRGVFAHFDGDD